jgi:hypothetical protein
MRFHALPSKARQRKVQSMKHDQYSHSRRHWVAGGLLTILAASTWVAAEAPPAATAAFNSYISKVEERLAGQHRSEEGLLASEDFARLQRGELIIEQLTPGSSADLPGALLHDWRGTAFVPGAKAADFERVMRDFNAYPQRYAPEVLTAKVLAQQGDRYQVTMRVVQKHVLTVVLDTAYDVTFGKLDAQRGYSISRSTKIAEIDSPGTAHERALGPGEEHGFMWRLNTYWSYEERDGGLEIQIESVSLRRSIPTGLGWLIGPFIESIPRESLEFTLNGTCKALKK